MSRSNTAPIGKFLYLSRLEWAEAWVHGGIVPIELASRYHASDRDGTLTPDELLQHRGPIDMRPGSPFANFFDFDNVRDVGMKNIRLPDGARLPDFTGAHLYREDGLVLCFSHVEDSTIARRLGNKEACVFIGDMERLRRSIDKQLGCRGMMKACEYTATHERGHFLKGEQDAWQQEYRIFWKRHGPVQVEIPAGTARLVAQYLP